MQTHSNHRIFLFILAALFVILVTASSIWTPPGEAPDETGHIARIDSFCVNLSEQELQSPPRHWKNEFHQPPLYYAILSPGQRIILGGSSGCVWEADPAFSFQVQGGRRYLPVAKECEKNVIFLRLLQIIFPVLTLVILYRMNRILANSNWAAFVATLLVMLNPQFLLLSSVVNNDNLMITAAALMTGLLIQNNKEWNVLRVFLIALVFAVGCMVKSSFLIFFVPMTLYLFVRKRFFSIGACFAWLIMICFSAVYYFSYVVKQPAIGPVSYTDLLKNPAWIGSCFISFWGKFGETQHLAPHRYVRVFSAPVNLGVCDPGEVDYSAWSGLSFHPASIHSGNCRRSHGSFSRHL